MATTNLQKAEQALEAARATVTEWTDKAAAARAEAAELDANSGAAILADPTIADDISIKVDACNRRARAFDGAATEARSQLEAAGRALLEAHAEQYDREANKARKNREAHDAKIGALLDQLEELDGVPYMDGREVERVKRNDPNLYTGRTIMARSVSDELAQAHTYARNACAYIRFYLATGKHPINPIHLSMHGGFAGSLASLSDLVDGTPPVFAQLATIGADPEFDAPVTDAHEDEVESELDPVLDADLIRLGAR